MKKHTYYAYRIDEDGKIIYMHDEIMRHILGGEIPEAYEVTHINGDGLDNRRENLKLTLKRYEEN